MSEAKPRDLSGIEAILDSARGIPGLLLPVLQDLQRAVGYIPDEAVPKIASALNLSRAEVHGVVSFYHAFHTTPGGQHRIHLCRAEACQSMGGRALEKHIGERLGIAVGGTTADGKVSLDAVYCLGNCACAPALMIDDEVHGRVTATRFDALLAELGAEAAAK